MPVDDLIREFFSLHRMLLSKTRLEDIDICLIPQNDIQQMTVNQLTKLNNHNEPVLLLTARSTSEYLIIRELEELTFRQQTGLDVDVSLVQRVEQENQRLRQLNEQQQNRIVDLEKQLSDLVSIRDEIKQFCKDYRKDMKKVIEKTDDYSRKIDFLGQKLNKTLLNQPSDSNSTRLKDD